MTTNSHKALMDWFAKFHKEKASAEVPVSKESAMMDELKAGMQKAESNYRAEVGKLGTTPEKLIEQGPKPETPPVPEAPGPENPKELLSHLQEQIAKGEENVRAEITKSGLDPEKILNSPEPDPSEAEAIGIDADPAEEDFTDGEAPDPAKIIKKLTDKVAGTEAQIAEKLKASGLSIEQIIKDLPKPPAL